MPFEPQLTMVQLPREESALLAAGYMCCLRALALPKHHHMSRITWHMVVVMYVEGQAAGSAACAWQPSERQRQGSTA